jgi:hypothetical protein
MYTPPFAEGEGGIFRKTALSRRGEGNRKGVGEGNIDKLTYHSLL